VFRPVNRAEMNQLETLKRQQEEAKKTGNIRYQEIYLKWETVGHRLGDICIFKF